LAVRTSSSIWRSTWRPSSVRGMGLATRHRAPPPSHARDLDWTAVLERARRWRVRGAVYFALRVVEDRSASPRPPTCSRASGRGFADAPSARPPSRPTPVRAPRRLLLLDAGADLLRALATARRRHRASFADATGWTPRFAPISRTTEDRAIGSARRRRSSRAMRRSPPRAVARRRLQRDRRDPICAPTRLRASRPAEGRCFACWRTRAGGWRPVHRVFDGARVSGGDPAGRIRTIFSRRRAPRTTSYAPGRQWREAGCRELRPESRRGPPGGFRC